MAKFVLKDGVYADAKVRTGVIVEITKATHFPVVVRFDDGSEGCIDLDDFDYVADVQVIETVEYEAAPTCADLIREAGKLNNSPKLVNTDHVSIMGLMDQSEMVLHVAKLREMAA